MALSYAWASQRFGPQQQTTVRTRSSRRIILVATIPQTRDPARYQNRKCYTVLDAQRDARPGLRHVDLALRQAYYDNCWHIVLVVKPRKAAVM
jgi:hypothetical protein